ncbi:MAG TPA: OB-fold domain-containing protein [Acidimicrobiales bacterium]|nr:OB-fold domain-containing protein [Acidimicrobiales bacterium]
MGALPSDWGVPELSDTNRAWFTSGAIAVQQCASCATLIHPPEEVCHECGSMSFGTKVLAPCGTVHSFTVVHYAANRALVDSVPYTVVLVSLDDAPQLRVVGNIEGPVEIGMKVVPYWEERSADDGTVVLLPQWRAANGS